MDKKQLGRFYEKECLLANWAALLSLLSMAAIGILIWFEADKARQGQFALIGLFFSVIYFWSRFRAVKMDEKGKELNKE